MRFQRFLVQFLGVAVFAAATLAAAGCGGGSVVVPPRAPASPTTAPTATPAQGTQSQPQTVALVANSPIQIPTVAGISGTITYPAGTIPNGTTVTLQTFLGAAPSAPTPQSARRRTLSSGPSVIASFTQTFSSAVSFNGFPVISINLASSAPTGAYTAELFDITNPLPAPYYEEGTGAANGSGVTVSFPGGGLPLVANAGDTYVTELVVGSALPPPPTPTPSPTPTPTPTAPPTSTPTPSPTPSGVSEGSSTTPLNGSAQTIPFPGVGGFVGSLQIPINPAPSGQTLLLNTWNGTPTTQVPLGSGSSVGSNVFSIEATLAQTESFGSGFFAFSLTFPASIPLSPTSTINIFVCTEGSNCTPGNAQDLSTTAFPFLFSISGQTLTFSGIPLPFTVTGAQTNLAEIYVQ